MRMKMLAMVAVALGTSALVALPSSAKDPGPHGDDNGKHDREGHDHDKGHDDDHRDARAHDDRDGSKGKEGDDDEKTASERREFRRGLFERREKDLVERLNHDRTVLSDEVRESIRVHWSHLARLARIRELALAAKEDALVKHVDEVIEREDKAFNAKLDKLRDKASGEGGAK